MAINKSEDQLKCDSPEFPSRPALDEWMESCIPHFESPRTQVEENEIIRDSRSYASGIHRVSLANPSGMPRTTEPTSSISGSVTPLLPETEIDELQARWNDIQADFVNEPRRSVKEADKLVASTVHRLAEEFSNERASLERQWDSGDHVSTEELRVTLQRYRAFFGKLLNAA